MIWISEYQPYQREDDLVDDRWEWVAGMISEDESYDGLDWLLRRDGSHAHPEIR